MGSVNDLMSFSQRCIELFQSSTAISYRRELHGDPVVFLLCISLALLTALYM